MAEPVTINPRIVEALYGEALVLSEQVRATFALPGQLEVRRSAEDAARTALSNEGLRTTTRMMHAIAWLLNHRAYFMGEISDFQLKRNGRLSPEMRHCDAGNLALLESSTVALVQSTCRFYERLLRLDEAWRLTAQEQESAISRLRERLEARLAS